MLIQSQQRLVLADADGAGPELDPQLLGHLREVLESGGGAAPSYVRHVFDGKTYVEAGRTAVGEVPPEGRWLLSGELGPSVGAPLAPRE